MLHVLRTVLSVLLVAVNTVTFRPTEARQPHDGQVATQERPAIRRKIPEERSTRALRFARTELYFGTAMLDGAVTESQFQDFIDVYVTPHFPDGLTIVKANGRFRSEDGDVVNEQSFVLVLLYPYETFAEASRRIEGIRKCYKQQFNQQSVLRVDDQFVVWVSY